jgi:hypothetical protein
MKCEAESEGFSEYNSNFEVKTIVSCINHCNKMDYTYAGIKNKYLNRHLYL